MAGGEAKQVKRLKRGPPAALQQSAPIKEQAKIDEPSTPQNAALTCGVCLEAPQERGVLNSCDHVFCFDCIMHWSKVTNRCPLCKARFKTVQPKALTEEASRKKHKQKVYRIADREQRVEWEPEGDELLDDDDFSDVDASEDSWLVPDEEVEDGLGVWGPSDEEYEAEEEEEEEEFEENLQVAGDYHDDDDDDDESDGEGDYQEPMWVPPRRRRRRIQRAASAPAAPEAAEAPRPRRRNITPAPRPASPPARKPAAAKRRIERVEIETPDGRILSVRRSKHSATPVPASEREEDVWQHFERSRMSPATSTVPAAASSSSSSRAPVKRRGAVASHALIAQALPSRLIALQRTSSSPVNSAPTRATPLSRSTLPSFPRSQTLPPLPPKSTSTPPPPPAAALPPPAVFVPPTPPSKLTTTNSSSSVPFPTPVPCTPSPPPSASSSVVVAPSSASSSASVSSPFKGNREERAALKRTVAERVKRMLTPLYREGRISLVQFKVIARKATVAFVGEEGNGADLRVHLRRAFKEEVGVDM